MNLKRTLKKKEIYLSIEKRQMNYHFKFIERNKNTKRNIYNHDNRSNLYREIEKFLWNLSMTKRYARLIKVRDKWRKCCWSLNIVDSSSINSSFWTTYKAISMIKVSTEFMFEKIVIRSDDEIESLSSFKNFLNRK